jgi:hypothetical protein
MSILLATSGCAHYSANQPIGALQSQTSPEQVMLIEGSPNRSFRVVGKVHSHCRWDWFLGWASCQDSTMKQALKEEAAKLGATAIMNITRDSFSQFEWTDVHYQATAFVWE